MERSSHGGRGVHGVIEEGNRADLIVENNVELKSLETLLPVHAKQVHPSQGNFLPPWGRKQVLPRYFKWRQISFEKLFRVACLVSLAPQKLGSGILISY